MIPDLKQMVYNKRLKTLKLWSLDDRRKRADLIEVYKMSRGLLSVDFSKFFTLDKSLCTRGHSRKLKKERFSTDLRQHFFSERIITWNSLDDDTVSANTLNCFKRRLLKWKDKDEFTFKHDV